jgi:predicted metal-dependent HD superfamily phosphohydrolase
MWNGSGFDIKLVRLNIYLTPLFKQKFEEQAGVRLSKVPDFK